MTIDQAFQLALDHHRDGRLQQAEQVYRQILQQQPRHAESLHLLGVLAQQVGNLEAGAQLISRAIAIEPNISLYHANLAEILRKLGQLDESVAAGRRAVQLEPNSSTGFINLGVTLQQQGKPDEAIVVLRRAIELDPMAGQAWSNLGNAFMAKNELETALEMGQRAINVQPEYAVAHNNLAAVLERMDRFAEAEVEYFKACELDPAFAGAWNNLGNVVRRQGRFRDAIKWWRRAVEANYDYPDAHWNLALAALALGDFEEGWPNYEWRFKCSHSRGYWREYSVPRWTGFDLTGKTILLYHEQGFGDVIEFARFIPEVVARGAKVILQCHKELKELMSSADGVWKVVGENEPLPPFDTYLPLLSVPFVLKTTLATLPAKIPYIHVDSSRVERWANRLNAEPGRLKVGLVYAGRATPDPKRSCRFAEFAPLADVEGVTWFSLQKGEAVAQLKDAPPNMRVINLDPELHDFADTAAALKALDLFISIDTAAIHLAGAIGANAWAMIPFACDFRWMLERDDSPWYPSMKLFRQKQTDDWGEVILRIRDELKRAILAKS